MRHLPKAVKHTKAKDIVSITLEVKSELDRKYKAKFQVYHNPSVVLSEESSFLLVSEKY